MRKPTDVESKYYKFIVTSALQFLFDRKNAKMIEDMAKQGDPADGVAGVVSMVIKGIVDAAKMANRQIPENILYPAVKEILMNVIKMLVDFQIIPKERAVQLLKSSAIKFKEITGMGKGGAAPKPAAQPQPQPQQPQQAGGLLAQGA